jgi:hypothetical protein
MANLPLLATNAINRQGRVWSRQEIVRMAALICAGYTHAQIAAHFGRTLHAIEMQDIKMQDIHAGWPYKVYDMPTVSCTITDNTSSHNNTTDKDTDNMRNTKSYTFTTEVIPATKKVCFNGEDITNSTQEYLLSKVIAMEAVIADMEAIQPAPAYVTDKLIATREILIQLILYMDSLYEATLAAEAKEC